MLFLPGVIGSRVEGGIGIIDVYIGLRDSTKSVEKHIRIRGLYRVEGHYPKRKRGESNGKDNGKWNWFNEGSNYL